MDRKHFVQVDGGKHGVQIIVNTADYQFALFLLELSVEHDQLSDARTRYDRYQTQIYRHRCTFRTDQFIEGMLKVHTIVFGNGAYDFGCD
jgi:hypothetical protein